MIPHILKSPLIRRDLLLITFLGALLFIPFLGSVHLFDWDEVNFAECSREMLLTHNYIRVQNNFEPFWEKPPLFFWLQTLSMHTFGVNEFAARFVNACCGIATLLIVYLIGASLYSRRLGQLWALTFAGSFLPSLFFRSGIMDPVFNLFIFLGLYFLSRATTATSQANVRTFLFAGLCTGLAVLTKGPVALLVSLLCVGVYSLVTRNLRAFSLRHLLLYVTAVASVSGIFYGIETLMNGPWFVTEFVRYQIRLLTTGDAGHGRPFWFHFVILLFGCFPASFFAIRAFGAKAESSPTQTEFKRWMEILFWVVLILFSIVKTKTVLYSSLCYFPITFLAAWHLNELLKNPPRLTWNKWLTISLISFGTLVGFAIAFFPYILAHKELIIPLIKDRFAQACLQKPVVWSGWEPLIGLLYLGALAVSFVMIGSRRLLPGIIVLFLGSALVLEAFMVIVAPKIESYTQGGPIQLYKSLRNTDCYARSMFKTYADLFYWEKKPGMRRESYDRQWLLNGPIDKPVYFVSRAPLDTAFVQRHQLTILKNDYGFIYLRRDPVSPAADTSVH